MAVLHDFTDDASHLARTLQNLRVRIPADLQSALDAPIPPSSRFQDLGSLTEEANRLTANANQFLITERVRITTMAMRNIANHVAFIPGRKSLIWLSGTFPFALNLTSLTQPSFFGSAAPTPANASSPRLFTDEIRTAVQALNQADLAIYPVDARRLSMPAGFASASARNSRRSL